MAEIAREKVKRKGRNAENEGPPVALGIFRVAIAKLSRCEDACKPYLDKLQLPEGYSICYILAVGYPDESPEAKPRDMGKLQFIK